MKVLALYLPAFHRIPENDAWWGEGFTEWDNVRKGRPLYRGHVQPREPLYGYYDLSEPHAISKQAFYAVEKGLDGFIFYHYWFQGHQLFERPLDHFLNDKKPDNFTYCLCWANETWARTWGGRGNNILIRQDYGDARDWTRHIEYLSEFFRDPHYLKKEGRPVLFLYSAKEVLCLHDMVRVWNQYLAEHGLKNLFLVETMRPHNMEPSACADAVFEFEPMYTIRYDASLAELAKRYMCKKLKLIDFQNYHKVWKKILTRKTTYGGLPIVKSGFVSWDNSPRKGRLNSIIVRDASPEAFGNYMYRLFTEDRQETSNDIIVINSWNEWGEGANLEPAKDTKESYLQALVEARQKYDARTQW